MPFTCYPGVKNLVDGIQASPESLDASLQCHSKIEESKKAIFSSNPKMSAEFMKETLLNKGRLVSFPTFMNGIAKHI